MFSANGEDKGNPPLTKSAPQYHPSYLFCSITLMDHQVYLRLTQTNGLPPESKLANYMVIKQNTH